MICQVGSSLIVVFSFGMGLVLLVNSVDSNIIISSVQRVMFIGLCLVLWVYGI